MLAIPAPLSKLPQGLKTTDSPIFAGLTVNGLTASRIVRADANKALAAASLSSFISGTTNRVSVADNGAGGVTLSGPQDLHTSGTPQFQSLTLSRASGPSELYHQRTTDADTYWLIQLNAGGDRVYYVKKPIASGTLTQAFIMTPDLNFGFGGTGGYGTGAKNVLAVQKDTAPSTSAANRFLAYAAEVAVGNTAPHFRTSAGNIVKLYQQAHIADPSGGSTVDSQARTAINSILAALENTGLLATS